MHGFWLLVHNIGYSLWLGAGIASMVAGVTAKGMAPSDRLNVYRVTSTIQRVLVGPGALATLVSGLVLAMGFMKSGAAPNWMNAMMGFGLLGALVTIGLSVPAAAKLGRLDVDARGELPEVFPALRKRLVITATIGGGLGLLAMIAATVWRF